MKGIAEDNDPHMLGVMRIYAKSWEAVTSQHIARYWKSSGLLYVSDVADVRQLYGESIGKSSQDEEFADLLSLMKKLTLDEQEELFIDLDVSSITTNDLCEWMDIESNINVKKER